MIVFYLMFCIIPFCLLVPAIKVHDGKVTLGDVFGAALFSMIPIVNLFVVIFSLLTIAQSKTLAKLSRVKLF